jgi:tryptophan halogenase
MADRRIQTLVIVGGQLTGWLVAAVLARVLKRAYCSIQLIDVPQLDPDSRVEVTNPAFHRLRTLLGIDEGTLLRRTRATFNLGQEIVGWNPPADRYFHAFGPLGARLDGVPFHHYWLRTRESADVTGVQEFSVAAQVARSGRFAHPLSDPRSVLSLYSYAYHFSSQLLRTYFKEYAEARGVRCVTGEVKEVRRRGEDGLVDSLVLGDGTRIEADLYLDCTGSRGTLARQALDAGFIDWSPWLPCDRAVTVECAVPESIPAYSQAIASSQGWQWRVPLQGSIECGQVYSSRFHQDAAALATLVDSAPAAQGDPQLLRFEPGRPRTFWSGNCVWIPGHTLDPLEPMRLHLVQTAVTRLLTTFPDRGFNPADADEYNRLTSAEYQRILDFLVLRYWTVTRDDSPFWAHCRAMAAPETLQHKVDLFRSSGRVSLFDDEHFGEESWVSVLLGQGVLPRTHDPLADVTDDDELRSGLVRMQRVIEDAVQSLPTHREFLERACHRAGTP